MLTLSMDAVIFVTPLVLLSLYTARSETCADPIISKTAVEE